MSKLIEMAEKVRTGSGTGEWADRNRNCIIGCSNDCAYCYSRAKSIKDGIVADRAAWPIEKIEEVELTRLQYKVEDLLMFPSRHDTTPANLHYNLPYLAGLLDAGNYVLFVTKASLPCIQAICRELVGYKEQLLIRITIGSMHPMLCKFWERNAPSPQERLMALQHAFEKGFHTSVSMEPILHGVEDAVTTFEAVKPFVTEKIWVGAMNGVLTRVDRTNQNFKKAIADLEKLQSRRELIRLYRALKEEPKVLWKESIRGIVNIL